MTRGFLAKIAAAAIVVVAVTAPAAGAVAAEPRDDDSGIVVGVEISPRPACSVGCGTVPQPEKEEQGWRLADSGVDVSPALLIALGLGASGLALAGTVRARAARPE
jgi:hypothetical protein